MSPLVSLTPYPSINSSLVLFTTYNIFPIFLPLLVPTVFPYDSSRLYATPLLPLLATGHRLVRQSSAIYNTASARLELTRGKEVWGQPGNRLSVPVSVTNMLDTSAVFHLDATNVAGFPMALSQRR